MRGAVGGASPARAVGGASPARAVRGSSPARKADDEAVPKPRVEEFDIEPVTTAG